MADVVGATGKGSRCRIELRVVELVENGVPRVDVPGPGETFKASVACYTSMLHQLRKRGRFKFKLSRTSTGALVVGTVGGRQKISNVTSTPKPPEFGSPLLEASPQRPERSGP